MMKDAKKTTIEYALTRTLGAMNNEMNLNTGATEITRKIDFKNYCISLQDDLILFTGPGTFDDIEFDEEFVKSEITRIVNDILNDVKVEFNDGAMLLTLEEA